VSDEYFSLDFNRNKDKKYEPSHFLRAPKFQLEFCVKIGEIIYNRPVKNPPNLFLRIFLRFSGFKKNKESSNE